MTKPAGSDCAAAYDPALGDLATPRGGLLDHHAVASEVNLECGVVEILNRAVFVVRNECLKQSAVRADEAATGAQRQPVQQHYRFLRHPGKA